MKEETQLTVKYYSNEQNIMNSISEDGDYIQERVDNKIYDSVIVTDDVANDGDHNTDWNKSYNDHLKRKKEKKKDESAL